MRALLRYQKGVGRDWRGKGGEGQRMKSVEEGKGEDVSYGRRERERGGGGEGRKKKFLFFD